MRRWSCSNSFKSLWRITYEAEGKAEAEAEAEAEAAEEAAEEEEEEEEGAGAEAEGHATRGAAGAVVATAGVLCSAAATHTDGRMSG